MKIKHVVWKVLKNSDDELTINIKPNKKYIVVNVDEPYAENIFNVLRDGEKEKGNWKNEPETFKEWLELEDEYCEEKEN